MINILLALAAILFAAAFIGALVVHRIRPHNQELAAVERALIKLGNSLAMEIDDEDAYDRLRVFERYIDGLEQDG